MACRSVGLAVFLSMQNNLKAPEQNMEQPLAMTAENVASYTRQTIIDAVRRFNTDILDTLDEWEVRGQVNALNELRQAFGLDFIPHNLNEDGPDHPSYIEENDEEGLITCDGCGNNCHKYNVADTESGNFCQHCNQPEETSTHTPENSEAIILNEKYWDCECEGHYIHAKADRLVCPVCGAEEENQPDSRENELTLPNTLFNQKPF